MEHGLLRQATPPIDRPHPPKTAPHPNRNPRWESCVAAMQRRIVVYGAFLILVILTGSGSFILATTAPSPSAPGLKGPTGIADAAIPATAHGQMQAAHVLKAPEDARAAVPLPPSLRNGLMAAGVILSAGIFIAMMYMLNRVIKPLKELGRAVYRMSHGQLDEPARVGDLKEIGLVGDMVNDMATDLQEMLLHVWNHTSQDIALLDRISGALGSDGAGNRLAPEIRKDFDFVRQDIQDMRAMVKAFDFYHVQIMDEKLVSKAHPQMQGDRYDGCIPA